MSRTRGDLRRNSHGLYGCAITQRRDLIIVFAWSFCAQVSRGESPRPADFGLLSNVSSDEQRRGSMPQALRDLGRRGAEHSVRVSRRERRCRASARSCDRTCHGRCHRHRFLRYSGDASRAESDKHNTYCRRGDGRSQSETGWCKATLLPKRTSRETRFSGPNSSPSGWDISRNFSHRSPGSACFGTRKRIAIRP